MKLRSAGVALAATLMSTIALGASSAQAISYTNTHLNCSFGGSKRVGVDVNTNPYTGAITRIQYNTVPLFHAEQVWVMVKPYGKTEYSTIKGTNGTTAVWGDGSTGSVETSFGSSKGAGYVIRYGYDKLKVKVDETDRIVTCEAVAGNP